MLDQGTLHANLRIQQRAIPPIVIEWLEEYGAEMHDGRGAIKRFFDHRSRKRLARIVGTGVVNRLNDYLDTFLVQTVDGTIITVGHRTKRVRRR